MQYRKDKYGNDISVLGYGCMRFTQTAGRIDMKKAEEEVMTAFQGGVNYFDTAYIYGGSEAALGEILERNGIRDRVYIATKLPHYLIRNGESLDRYFQEQCRRLRTDHIDYYLMHMLTDVQTWERLKDLGILEWLREKQESGAICQVGFSYHGNADMFCQLVDAYDWDFCQIQYNYMDENSQAGQRGLRYAHQKGMPVIIMEPLRGGKLVTRLPDAARKIFSDYSMSHPAARESGREGGSMERTPAQWALKWLWNQPEVTCVLSGMNSVEMVKENLHTAANTRVGELTEADQAMLQQVVKAINARMKVGCTGCGYCMPCPRGVDIPGSFAAYNRRYSEGWVAAMKDYFMCTAIRKDSSGASNCVECGKCERHCPQHISIRQELKGVKKSLENPVYRMARWIVKKMKAY
ncbi:MAG: aldo/keto reductase [Lachnospiraceae bacterium]|nr:aldo/keto reductase [Lachnospiraceae bacterium]